MTGNPHQHSPSHEVFLSFSHEDKATADAACHFLEEAGVRCWIAPRDVPAGATWSEAIVDAIGASRAMVLIFSGSSNASPQVLREVERAVNGGIPILPVRIEDVLPSRGLGYFISTQHWLDALTPPIEDRLRELVRAVLALLEEPRSSEGRASPGSAARADSWDRRGASASRPRRAARAGAIVAGTAALAALAWGGWQLFRGEEHAPNDSARDKLTRALREGLAVSGLLGTEENADRRLHQIQANLTPENLERAFRLPEKPIGAITIRAFQSDVARGRAEWVRELSTSAPFTPLKDDLVTALAGPTGEGAPALGAYGERLKALDRACAELAQEFEGLAKELNGSVLEPPESLRLGLWRLSTRVRAIDLEARRAHREALRALTRFCHESPRWREQIGPRLAGLKALEPRALLTPELEAAMTRRIEEDERALAKLLEGQLEPNESAASREARQFARVLAELDDLEILPKDDEKAYVLKAVVAREVGNVERSAQIYAKYGERFGESVEYARSYARVAQVYTRDPESLRKPQALYVYLVDDRSPARALVRVGDVLEAFNGVRITSQSGLIDYKGQHAGERVEIQVFRITPEHPQGTRLRVETTVPSSSWGLGLQQI